ncbi:MAG TPA: winged helix-turn-helix domain-containing protein, partial [Nitrososphaeraceae archaeon]|nr:winged helix-turn-helix domain-containing protein [Nitrososphaeraceae archaeon]
KFVNYIRSFNLVLKPLDLYRIMLVGIYRLLHKLGFKQKVPRKVHVNSASEEEKEQFKKERAHEVLENLH